MLWELSLKLTLYAFSLGDLPNIPLSVSQNRLFHAAKSAGVPLHSSKTKTQFQFQTQIRSITLLHLRA